MYVHDDLECFISIKMHCWRHPAISSVSSNTEGTHFIITMHSPLQPISKASNFIFKIYNKTYNYSQFLNLLIGIDHECISFPSRSMNLYIFILFGKLWWLISIRYYIVCRFECRLANDSWINATMGAFSDRCIYDIYSETSLCGSFHSRPWK